MAVRCRRLGRRPKISAARIWWPDDESRPRASMTRQCGVRLAHESPSASRGAATAGVPGGSGSDRSCAPMARPATPGPRDRLPQQSHSDPSRPHRGCSRRMATTTSTTDAICRGGTCGRCNPSLKPDNRSVIPPRPPMQRRSRHSRPELRPPPGPRPRASQFAHRGPANARSNCSAWQDSSPRFLIRISARASPGVVVVVRRE